MDTDSDSEEDCLIPERLLHLKNNSQSQSPFSHSQRMIEKFTSSSQRDSQRWRNAPAGSSSAQNSSRQTGLSTCPAPAGARSGTSPSSSARLSQHRTQHQDSPAGSFRSPDAVARVVSLSSPDEPVMLSLCTGRGKQGHGQGITSRMGTTPRKALSYEDAAVPETSGVETISETDFSSGGEVEDKAVKSAPRAVVSKTSGTSIPSSSSTASQRLALSQKNGGIAGKPTSATVSTVPATCTSASTSTTAQSKGGSTAKTPSEHKYTVLGYKPVNSSSEYNIGAVWQTVCFDSDDDDDDDEDFVCKPSSQNKTVSTTCVPSDPVPTDETEEEEELLLPAVSFHSKHKQNTHSQAEAAGSSFCPSSSSLSSAKQHQPEGSSLWSRNKSQSHEASSSDADIESVGSASDTEEYTGSTRSAGGRQPGTKAQRSMAEAQSSVRTSSASRQAKTPEADDGDGHQDDEHTVVYEDSSQENCELSPSILQPDTRDVQGAELTSSGQSLVRISSVGPRHTSTRGEGERITEPAVDSQSATQLMHSVSHHSATMRSGSTAPPQRKLSDDFDMTQPYELSDAETQEVFPPTLRSIPSIPSLLQRQVSGQSLPPPQLTSNVSDLSQPPPLAKRSSSAVSDRSQSTQPPSLSRQSSSAVSDRSQSTQPPSLSRQSSSAVSDHSQFIQPPSLSRQSSSVVAESSSCSTESTPWPALTTTALGQVKREREGWGHKALTLQSTASGSEAQDSPVYEVKREPGYPQRGFSVTVPIDDGSAASGSTGRLGGVPSAAESLTISVALPAHQGSNTVQVKREAGGGNGADVNASSLLLPKKEEREDPEFTVNPGVQCKDEDDANSDQSQCLFDELPAPTHTDADAGPIPEPDVYLSDAEEEVEGGGSSGGMNLVVKVSRLQQDHQPSTSYEQDTLCPMGPQVVIKQEKSVDDDGAAEKDDRETDFVGYTVEDDQVVVFDSDEEEMFSSFTQVMVKNEVCSDDDEGEEKSLWVDDIWDTQPIEILSDAESEEDEARSRDSGVALSKDGEVKVTEANMDTDGDFAMDSADDDDLYAASEDIDQKAEEKTTADRKKSIFSQPTLEDETVGDAPDDDDGDMDSVYQNDTQVDSDMVGLDSESDDRDNDRDTNIDNNRQKLSPSHKDKNADDFDDDMDGALYTAATQIDEEMPLIRSPTESHSPLPIKQEAFTSEGGNLTDKPCPSLPKQTARKSAQSTHQSSKGKAHAPKKEPESNAPIMGEQTKKRTVSDILRSKPSFLQTMDSISHRTHSKTTPDVVDLTQDSSDDEVSFITHRAQARVKVKSEVAASEEESSKDKASQPSHEEQGEKATPSLLSCATLAEDDHFPDFDDNLDDNENDDDADSRAEKKNLKSVFEAQTLIDDDLLGGEPEEEEMDDDADNENGDEAGSCAEKKNLHGVFEAQTLAYDNLQGGETEEEAEMDVYAMATQRDFDPYLAATQLDTRSLSDSDDDHSDDGSDKTGEKRKRSSSESDAASDVVMVSPARAEVEEKDPDLESISDTDFDYYLEESDKGSDKSELSKTSLRSKEGVSRRPSSPERSFAHAREAMMKIKQRNLPARTLEISPQPDQRRRGKKVGLKQKLSSEEACPARQLMQQRSLSSSNAEHPQSSSSTEPKGILRSASTDQQTAGTSSATVWLGKKPNLAAPKASKPSGSKRRPKRAKAPATPDLYDIKKAHEALEARHIKAIAHPEQASASRHKEAAPQCDFDTDVELPSTQQMFDMGLPLMNRVTPVAKNRLARAGNKIQRHSTPSASHSTPLQEAAKNAGSFTTSEHKSEKSETWKEKIQNQTADIGSKESESRQQDRAKSAVTKARDGEHTAGKDKTSKSDARHRDADEKYGVAKTVGKLRNEKSAGDKTRSQEVKTSSSVSKLDRNSLSLKHDKQKGRSRHPSDDAKKRKPPSSSGSLSTDSREERGPRPTGKPSLVSNRDCSTKQDVGSEPSGSAGLSRSPSLEAISNASSDDDDDIATKPVSESGKRTNIFDQLKAQLSSDGTDSDCRLPDIVSSRQKSRGAESSLKTVSSRKEPSASCSKKTGVKVSKSGTGKTGDSAVSGALFEKLSLLVSGSKGNADKADSVPKPNVSQNKERRKSREREEESRKVANSQRDSEHRKSVKKLKVVEDGKQRKERSRSAESVAKSENREERGSDQGEGERKLKSKESKPKESKQGAHDRQQGTHNMQKSHSEQNEDRTHKNEHRAKEERKHIDSEKRRGEDRQPTGGERANKPHKDSEYSLKDKQHRDSKQNLKDKQRKDGELSGGGGEGDTRTARKRRHSSGSSSASAASTSSLRQSRTESSSSSGDKIQEKPSVSNKPKAQQSPTTEEGVQVKRPCLEKLGEDSHNQTSSKFEKRSGSSEKQTNRPVPWASETGSMSRSPQQPSKPLATERVRPPTPPRRSEISPREDSVEENNPSASTARLPGESAALGKAKKVRFNLNIQYRCVSPRQSQRPPGPPSNQTLPNQTLPTFQEILNAKPAAGGRKGPPFVGNPLQKRLPPLQEMQQQQQQQRSTIREFVSKPLVVESNHGNQASGSGENAAPGRSLLDPQDLLTSLLRWSPKWLIEYDKAVEKAGKGRGDLPTIPPVVDLKRLYPLLTTYGNKIEEYQQICFKLLLLETWEDIYRGWKEKNQKVPPWHVVLAQACRPVSQNIIFEWTGLLTENEWRSGHCPREGDLLVLKMLGWYLPPSGSLPSQHAPQRKEESNHSLAYVERSRTMKCQDVHRLLNEHQALRNHPAVRSKEKNLYLLKVKVKMRYRKFAPNSNALMTMESIGTLTPAMRRFSALQMLPRCPLMRDVLSPSPAAAGVNVAIPPATGGDMLNEAQSRAVRIMLRAVLNQPPHLPRITLLQGPPGTGKSYVIGNLILRILQGNPKAKICLAAPSNAAADELMRRLLKKKKNSNLRYDMVRIGQMDSTHSDVKQFALESKVQKAKQQALRQKKLEMVPETVKSEHERLERKLVALEDRVSQLRLQRKMPEVAVLERDIRKEKKRMEILNQQIEQGKQNIELTPEESNRIYVQQLKEPQIVCGTLSSFGHPRILETLRHNPTSNRNNNQHFTCAIIDEATQATELDSLIPLQYGVTKLFMVGDPNQLPPTVLSPKAQSLNYNLSLFERFYNHFNDQAEQENPVMMLTKQYRMDPAICHFPNQHVYRGQLVTDSQVNVHCGKFALHPYVIFDVEEGQELLSQSGTLSNMMEADCTAILCKQLLRPQLRICTQSIGIICPYAGQKRLVIKKLRERGIEGIEVNTVDGFQGREKHVIILSCVRARSATGGIGFMADTRRMNVALTRAKYALYIIGHLQSLEMDRDWRALVVDAREREDRTVIQRVNNLQEFPELVLRCCFKQKYRPSLDSQNSSEKQS